MPYIVLDPTTAQAAPAISFGAPDTVAKHPAGKSLSAMRTRLTLEVGNRVGDQVLTPAVLNEWINDAYIDLFGSLDLPEANASFQLLTVINQPFYLLPPGVDTIRMISEIGTDWTPTDNTRGKPLRKIDLNAYRRLPALIPWSPQNPQLSYQPSMWLREGTMLVLYPTPDNVYTLAVDVVIKPQPLVADTDYPILEDKWHEPLFKAAKYRAWEGIQNDTKALTTMNESARLIQRKNDRDAGDQANEYPTFRPIRSRHELNNIRATKPKPWWEGE